MSVTTLFTGRSPAEGDPVTDIYRYAARKGVIEAVEVAAADLGLGLREAHEAVANLVESRLLRVDDSEGRRFVPVDPELASASLVSSVEREIYQRRELIDQIRERMGAFRSEYGDAGRSSAASAVEYLVGAMEVRGFLKMAGDACRDEVLAMQAAGGDVEDLSQMYLTLLARGVTVRIICQHRSRADVSTRMLLKRLTDAGAAVFTVSHVPRSAVVFDRALVVMFGVEDDGEASVARVHSHGIAKFLLDLFNHLWETATPLEGVEVGYANVADDLQQAIASLMAKGYTDEVVARKLGMSVRSCRRHIALLMRDLDATSRFQAGVQAARKYLGAAG
jgi:DNA-binding CsgD family transcriptional regulator/sugar-specific transcriptional regulator TrmB